MSLLFDFTGFVNFFCSTNSPSHVEAIVLNELVVVEGAVVVLSSTKSPHIEVIVLDALVVVLL